MPSIHQFRHSIEHAASHLHASTGMIMTTTAKSTSSQAQPSLRRRMHRHMLDRAPSLSSLNSLASAELKILPEITHRARRGKDGQGQEDQEEVSPETEYESRTSSDEEDEDDTPPEEVTSTVTGTTRPEKGKEKMSPSPGRPQRPKLDTLGLGAATQLQSSPRMRYSSSSSMSPTSRAWYEFDLAVVVALVSPIGNWLTGGDHIKNLLLIVLLIFYLHQIIESTSLSSPLPLPTLTDAYPLQSSMGPLPKITPKAPFSVLSSSPSLRRLPGNVLQDVRNI